ncbi:VOC family protein [Hydrogenophaga sp. PBL-H3]|uniref:VOC family protein n=1 Tax=Hydrogenophaga sp. PBL-H3 TaxID=434010 RepID=UPI00131FEC4A|nr:VOC family protein [Hydrogenophaga sp. PBL-H3]QHE76903.1 glyoxalase [Hydrogenophaga sp. PBL-H3]QHE81327.1 glyoxalase [Hydrogenophaga sp. PBL-H3]
MSIHSINHVQLGFAAGQQSQVRHFYSELLGLTEFKAAGGNALRFFAGPQRVDLVPVTDWHGTPAPAHLAFEVQNLPGFRAKLIDAGYELDESRPLGGHLRFYVNDPAGNTLEFLEPDLSQEHTQ